MRDYRGGEEMVQDAHTRIVVFRVWRPKDGGSVLALFPGIQERDGLCSSYAHIGQHGAADYAACIRRSRPATTEEAADLRQELESLGYRLSIRQRWVSPIPQSTAGRPSVRARAIFLRENLFKLN